MVAFEACGYIHRPVAMYDEAARRAASARNIMCIRLMKTSNNWKQASAAASAESELHRGRTPWIWIACCCRS